jgi:diacylglycerol kinase (ATP)
MSLDSYDGPLLTLVVNPAAGRGRARRLLPQVTAGLLGGLPEAALRVVQTGSFADARLRCIQAVDQARPAVPGHRRDALLVMGGDGMMHLGLNAAATTSAAVSGCRPTSPAPSGRSSQGTSAAST